MINVFKNSNGPNNINLFVPGIFFYIFSFIFLRFLIGPMLYSNNRIKHML
jgi:hypothetical protein